MAATAASIAVARNNDPSDDESAEDLLEKMLKQAEELAQKMSRQGSSEVSVTTSTDAGSDLSDPVLADVTNGSIKVDDLSSDNDTELEELLKQSETLLGKMRAGGLASTPEDSVSSPPPADKVEPPKVSPNAPTSVYLLENCGTNDDVSSVGSNSLRSPVITPSLRMPTYSSSTDPIQEEPFSPAPKRLPRIASINSATDLLEATAADPKTIAMVAKIPDFTVTSPDAKWEKVASASQGDDDYVPLVDYSKLSPNTAATTASSGAERPYVDDDDDDDDDDEAYQGSAGGITSRVAAFRAQKKRLQKKRRRQMAALAMGIALVGGYCIYARRQIEDSSISKEVEIEANTATNDVDVIAASEYDPIMDEVFDGVDNLITLSDAEQFLSETDLKDILDILREEELMLGDKEEQLGLDASEEEVSGTDTDVAAEKSTIKVETAVEVITETNDQVDSNKLVKICKNPLQKIFNRRCRELVCQTDACLEKRCKNIIQRIFNRKCRVLARQKKGKKKEFGGINLQAVAGI
jgi:hypothetical protein